MTIDPVHDYEGTGVSGRLLRERWLNEITERAGMVSDLPLKNIPPNL